MSKELVRDLIFRSGANKSTKIAYISGETTITWGEINQRSNQAVSVFQSLGIKQGDPIGILSPETIEVYEHFFTCFKMGAIRVGLNLRFSDSELLHVVKDAGIKMIMVHADGMDLLNGIAQELEEIGVILIGFAGPHGLQNDYETLIDSGTNEPVFPFIDPASPAIYTYTSGTTGSPKGVILSDLAVRTVIQGAPGALGFAPDDIFYCPLANAWAAVVANLLCLSNGMTTVIPCKKYDTAGFLNDVERIGVTAALLAPTMMQWVIDELDKTDHDVSSFRLLFYGSAPATPKLISEFRKRFECDLVQGYGTSECCAGWISSLSPADHDHALREKPEMLQSAGRIPSYFDLSIRDDNGNELSVGEIGEIWVRGDAVMSGYLNLPEQTDEVLKEKGWLITNDMGVLDEAGYLYLKDRRKFMIVTGGVNVFPAHVEAVVSEHSAIAEIAVVGVPHSVWGEAVIAVVRLKEDESATQEELLAYCNGKLGKVMMPKYVHFVEEPLPKSTNLKVLKPQIQAWFKNDPSLLPDSFKG